MENIEKSSSSINSQRLQLLADRVNKLIQLNFLHEREREEAKSLVENYHHENECLKYELTNLHQTATNLAQQLDTLPKDLRVELDSLARQLDLNNESINQLNRELQAKTTRLTTQQSEIDLLNKQLEMARTRHQEVLAKYTKLKSLNTSLKPCNMNKIEGMIMSEHVDRQTKLLNLEKLIEKYDGIERFYEFHLDKNQQIKRELIEMYEVVLCDTVAAAYSVRIEHFCLKTKSIEIVNMAAVDVDMSGWVFRIVNSVDMELATYVFGRAFRLVSGQSVTLSSPYAADALPGCLLMQQANPNVEELIWLWGQNSLTCLLENELGKVCWDFYRKI